jgi:hypothetical protein
VVPGATVTVMRGPTVVRTTVTDATGRYTVDNLEPGPYEVTFDLSGFASQTTRVVVSAGPAFSTETTLQLGSQTEVIQVTGTLIPRPTLEAMSPVTTIDAESFPIGVRAASKIS